MVDEISLVNIVKTQNMIECQKLFRVSLFLHEPSKCNDAGISFNQNQILAFIRIKFKAVKQEFVKMSWASR